MHWHLFVGDLVQASFLIPTSAYGKIDVFYHDTKAFRYRAVTIRWAYPVKNRCLDIVRFNLIFQKAPWADDLLSF